MEHGVYKQKVECLRLEFHNRQPNSEKHVYFKDSNQYVHKVLPVQARNARG
jgi:predicted metal-dependent hydrolase